MSMRRAVSTSSAEGGAFAIQTSLSAPQSVDVPPSASSQQQQQQHSAVTYTHAVVLRPPAPPSPEALLAGSAGGNVVVSGLLTKLGLRSPQPQSPEAAAAARHRAQAEYEDSVLTNEKVARDVARLLAQAGFACRFIRRPPRSAAIAASSSGSGSAAHEEDVINAHTPAAAYYRHSSAHADNSDSEEDDGAEDPCNGGAVDVGGNDSVELPLARRVVSDVSASSSGPVKHAGGSGSSRARREEEEMTRRAREWGPVESVLLGLRKLTPEMRDAPESRQLELIGARVHRVRADIETVLLAAALTRAGTVAPPGAGSTVVVKGHADAADESRPAGPVRARHARSSGGGGVGDDAVGRPRHQKTPSTYEREGQLGFLNHTDNNPRDKQHVCQGERLLLAWMRLGYVEDLVPLHRVHARDKLCKDSLTCWFRFPLNTLRDYYGEACAFYFAWMQFYTAQLMVPAAVGVIVWYIRDPAVSAIFGLFVALWASAFVTKMWKRRRAELCMQWRITPDPSPMLASATARPRLGFRGMTRVNPITGHIGTWYRPGHRRHLLLAYAQSAVVTLLMLGMALSTMVLLLNLQGYVRDLDSPLRINWVSSWAEPGALLDPKGPYFLWLFPVITHSVLIAALNHVYSPLATWLTEQENHRTEAAHAVSLMTKRVLFSCADSYLPLFYLAFVEGNMEHLRTELAALFMGDEIRRVLTESALPYAMRKLSPAGEVAQTVIPNVGDVSYTGAPYESTYADFIEMFVQYGYVVLFGSAFPLAAFFSVLSNVVEVRSDLIKLTYVSRRPEPLRVVNLGVWETVLEVFSCMSVLTNCVIMNMYSDDVLEFVPGDRAMKVLIAENILVILALLVRWRMPDVPFHVERAIARDMYHALHAGESEMHMVSPMSPAPGSLNPFAHHGAIGGGSGSGGHHSQLSPAHLCHPRSHHKTHTWDTGGSLVDLAELVVPASSTSSVGAMSDEPVRVALPPRLPSASALRSTATTTAAAATPSAPASNAAAAASTSRGAGAASSRSAAAAAAAARDDDDPTEYASAKEDGDDEEDGTELDGASDGEEEEEEEEDEEHADSAGLEMCLPEHEATEVVMPSFDGNGPQHEFLRSESHLDMLARLRGPRRQSVW